MAKPGKEKNPVRMGNRSRVITINVNEAPIAALVKRIGWFPFLLVFLVSHTFGSGQGNPSEGKRLFRHYCAVCHGEAGKGDGINSKNLDPLPRDFTDLEYMSDRTDQQLFDIIQGGGPAVAMSVYMPPFGKTLSEQQIWNLVAYIRTLFSGKPLSAPKKTAADRGLMLGAKSDCPLCHMKERKYKPIAPNLGQVGSKLNRDWVYNFLKSPDRIRPVGFAPLTKSTMPNFQLSDEDALAVTEYLMTLKDDGISRAIRGDLDLSQREINKGRRLFEDRYGCIGCHKVNGRGGVFGPDLTQAAKRLRPEWIFRWIQNPQAIEPDSPMPNFDLPDNRIRPLIAYILSLGEQEPSSLLALQTERFDEVLVEKGKKIIKTNNCFFCHKMGRVNSRKMER